MAKILVTGASAGFGKLFVNTLIGNGHTVVASMRDAEGRNKAPAEECRSLGAAVVEIDVTDEASVEAGVAAAIEAAGGLDVVVNNAGVGVEGVQESFTVEDWQRVFDVNVFGVQRMMRAVLPHLRSQGSGLVVQISSLLGRVTIPWYGPYNSTKWALEAMSENYRAELSGFGVDVVIVEPGGFLTDFIGSLITPSDNSRDGSLGELPEIARNFTKGFADNLAGEAAPNPQMVADAVAELVNTPAGERPFRTVVDGLGMGDAIVPYNEAHAQLTGGLYASMGMDGMLQLRTGREGEASG